MVCHVFDYCCGFFSPWRNKKCISNSRWVIDICIVYTEWRRNVCAKPFYTHIHTYTHSFYLMFKWLTIIFFSLDSHPISHMLTYMKELKRLWNDFDCSPKDHLPRSNRVPAYVRVYLCAYFWTHVHRCMPCTTLLNNIPLIRPTAQAKARALAHRVQKHWQCEGTDR